MQANFTLKDLTDISTRIDICKVSDKKAKNAEYDVSVYTNALGGDINAFFRIDYFQDASLGGTVLFSFRSGEQICLTDLNYKEQLIIPEETIAQLKNSLSVKVEVFGQSIGVWSSTIDKINAKHSDDTNNNFEKISTDLPIPDFKYVEVPKKKSKIVNFFSTLFDSIHD